MSFPRKHTFARARSSKVDANGMNSTEAKFAAFLAGEKLAGRIADYRFQPITLKLAEGLRYTPDFLVIENSLEYTCYEIKGAKKKKDSKGEWHGEWTYWAEEDAKIKIKVAAQVFPELHFFVAFQPSRMPWLFQEVEHHD